ncbi:CoA ester lyase, partial [Streptomyces sp. SID10115]|uniref:aldolase/citrate lyase family protein n=3 Tax=Streptomyces TaxID=1883 RepID=UPI0013C80BF0|nr:CoA ester lyase [Streptomyces sp. SID10115]
MTTPTPLTWLYAPGDRPDVVAKALLAGADAVIVDLEDAVAPDRKAYARAATAELLSSPQPLPVHVRVNALDGPLAEDDLRAVAPLPGVAGLRLPTVTTRA